MLVLHRNPGQTIVIGDNIRVTLVRQHGGGARIGIEAPPEVPIHREEVYERDRLPTSDQFPIPMEPGDAR